MSQIKEDEEDIDELLQSLNGIEKCFEIEDEPEAQVINIIESQSEEHITQDEVFDAHECNATRGKRHAENSSHVSPKKKKKKNKSSKSSKSSSKSKYTGSCTASSLPIELLMKIFEYLPNRDRKATKLVCRRWYDTCSSKIFKMAEKYVCCGIYDTDLILNTIRASLSEYLNLEFYRIDFSKEVPEFWSEVGPAIHILHFVDCVISEDTLKKVITHCTEMEHLSIRFMRMRKPPPEWSSFSLFENLSKEKIVRSKMISLDLYISLDRWFSNYVLSSLFSVFPNITRLTYFCHMLDSSTIMEITGDRYSKTKLTHGPALEHVLRQQEVMEKMHLSLKERKDQTEVLWRAMMIESNLKSLRAITLEIDLKILSADRVLEFCCELKELKNVSCKIIGSGNTFVPLFMYKLLESCPNLRHLNISYHCMIYVNPPLMNILATSKLKTLHIVAKSLVLKPFSSEEEIWPVNKYLKSLILPNTLGYSLEKYFIKTFRHLKFLEIESPNDSFLALIWKYQTDLISLKIIGVDECSAEGFCGSNSRMTFEGSIEKLRKLEYLALQSNGRFWDPQNDFLFSELDLLSLRYVCVDIETTIYFYRKLFKTLKRCRNLEAVSITCPGIERTIFLVFFENWKKLRYLRIVDEESEKFKSKYYHRFFKKLPALRALVHEWRDGRESYYYDVLERTVKKSKSSAKFRISSEKVAGNLVDWLWF